MVPHKKQKAKKLHIFHLQKKDEIQSEITA